MTVPKSGLSPRRSVRSSGATSFHTISSLASTCLMMALVSLSSSSSSSLFSVEKRLPAHWIGVVARLLGG